MVPKLRSEGSRRVSDTNNLRYLESHLAIENDERWSATHLDLQMVRKNRYGLDKLLDQDPALLAVCCGLHAVDIQLLKDARSLSSSSLKPYELMLPA